MVNQTYNVDIIPGGAPVVVHLHQNDMIGRGITLNLFSRNGDLNVPNSATAFIEGQKPDGTFFSYNANRSGRKVSYTITNQMAAVRGDTWVQCKILSGNEVIMAANYIHRIQGDLINGAPVSGTEIPGLVQQAQAAAEAAERAAENIDDNWFINGANNTNLNNLTTRNKQVVSALNEVNLVRGEAQETDADDITTPGWYYINPAITTQNMPDESSGLMEVYRGTYSTYILQRFTTTYTNRIYERFYGSAVWTDWKSYDQMGFMYRSTLPDGTDCNDITESGRYFLSDIRTYPNAPTDMVWGQFEVLRAGTSGLAIMQRITGAGSDGFATVRSWERLTINGGLTWGEWKEVMFGVSSGVETIPDQTISGSAKLKARKTGAVVWVEINGNIGEEVSSEITVGNLPANWRPAANTYFDQMVVRQTTNSAKAIFGYYWINPSGVIKLTWLRTTGTDGAWINATIPRNASMCGNFTFIAEQ